MRRHPIYEIHPIELDTVINYLQGHGLVVASKVLQDVFDVSMKEYDEKMQKLYEEYKNRQ